MMDTAVILAAGLGSRLREITKERPKGFIAIDGRPIIERSLLNLFGAGVRNIIIGTGYLSGFYERLHGKYPQVRCVKNDRYAETGSMYTLSNLKSAIDTDFLLLESDLMYEKRGLSALSEDTRRDVLLASGPTGSRDEVYIEVDNNCHLVNMSKERGALESVYAELVGISKISYSTYLRMCVCAEREPGLDYENALVRISKDVGIFVKKIDDYLWCEIDDKHHLCRAKRIIYPQLREKGEFSETD
jgi:2-aminoethylphosphonate-pyruvate transaminase